MFVQFLDATAWFGFSPLESRSGKILNRSIIQVLGLDYSRITMSVVCWDHHN